VNWDADIQYTPSCDVRKTVPGDLQHNEIMGYRGHYVKEANFWISVSKKNSVEETD